MGNMVKTNTTKAGLRQLGFVGCSLLCVAFSSPAYALIPTAVGGASGETDISARVSLERGKVEPNENTSSWQKARWEQYTLDAGHNFGDHGIFKDFFIRFAYTFVNSPAETNEKIAIPAGSCLGRVTDVGQCEFHAANRSHILMPALGWNFVHKGDYAFGVFFQGMIPIGLDYAKFVNPRVDYFGGGTSVGVRLTPWLSYESRLYFGSGLIESKRRQNATVAIINAFGFEAQKWLLPYKIGIKLGPYFDGDLTERTDERYDAAYTVGYAQGVRDRIRMMRFALAAFPYIQVSKFAVIEASYVQKIFGYDTPATQFYTIGVRAAF
jgi:hypothetical protein